MRTSGPMSAANEHNEKGVKVQKRFAIILLSPVYTSLGSGAGFEITPNSSGSGLISWLKPRQTQIVAVKIIIIYYHDAIGVVEYNIRIMRSVNLSHDTAYQ